MVRVVHVARHFAELRWRLLRNSLRGEGSERIGVIVSTVLSAVIGVVGATALLTAGRTVDDASQLWVLVIVIGTTAVVSLGVVSGISQPVDPRVLATEPLSEPQRLIGFLSATAAGPPGLATILVGAGMVVGAARGPASLLVIVPAVATWLVLLLVTARTVTNLLALLVDRAPRLGQVLMGVGGLAFYATVQLAPPVLARLEPRRRERLTEVLAATPLGQLGRSIDVATESAVAALPHLAAGTTLVPLLGVVYVWSTRRLAGSIRHHGSAVVGRRVAGTFRDLARRTCGTGAVGAAAWRSVLTRFRTPRVAIETFLGAGVGLAAVLAPVLVRPDPGSGAVLVGGAVQLAVLFMAGNSFGNDGPALTGELLTGADTRTIARAKARSIVVVAAPVAAIGPLIAAGVTGEWRFLPAGVLVGIGGLLAGTGGALVQSTFVPIAMPDSDHPFAHGESGRGIVSALLLLGVLIALGLVTLPLFLALFWANAFGSARWVTLFGAVTMTVGWAVMRGGVALSARRLTTRGPEFVRAITPSR